jgi:thiamine biosynthesis protein ThiS
MQIKVNGEFRVFEAPLNVLTLTEQLAVNPAQVAIERNREIITRSRYSDTTLADGDEIEIVRFIGGG